MEFTADLNKVKQKINEIAPSKYAKTRNFIDGSVTRLSPYISRGVISTKMVFQNLTERGYNINNAEKIIQELAWRDYWQQIWVAKKDLINEDLKRPQEGVENREIPTALLNADTGIQGVDSGINELYETGYMHNHVRMYTAAITCNIGKSAWKNPAKWMYYYLVDGDWASNALSWQWVAGSNAGKKYYANQNNINKYTYTRQSGTFLDVDYTDFENMSIPEVLRDTSIPELKTKLPETNVTHIDPALPVYLYNWYNLDPEWDADVRANRVLLLEPSIFEKYPISGKSVKFMLELSKNIDGIQVFTGEFEEFTKAYGVSNVHYKEHPLNEAYIGTQHERDRMFDVTGYYRSFFSIFKKCKKSMK